MEPFDLRKWSGFKGEQAIIDQIQIDSRRIESKNALFVALKGRECDGHQFVKHARDQGCRFALVKKGFYLDGIELIHVEDPLKAFQEIAKTYREQFHCHVVAVAGSFGKTMVKDLMFEILVQSKKVMASPESFNSQIGVPLSLLRLKREHELAIIEMAVTQKGEMDSLLEMVQPTSSLLTPLGVKPSARSLEIVKNEIEKLLNHPLTGFKLVPSSHAKGMYWDVQSLDLPHAERFGDKYRLHFPKSNPFEHHLEGIYHLNLINMATKGAWLLGAKQAEIESILSNYSPGRWRCEIWKSPQGITFINDTYSSDPQSLRSSLKHFSYLPSTARKVVISNRNFEGIEHLYPSLTEYKPHAKENDFVLIKGSQKEPLDQLISLFNDSIHVNQCFINLAAIKANLEVLKAKLGCRLMVIVKAQAYGTDATRLCRFLANSEIDIFGVSFVDEAIALRQAGITQSLFVLQAAPFEAAKVAKWDLEVGVSQKEMIEALAKEEKPIKVHLHVDTGMSRFGCRPEEALDLVKQITHSPLKLEGLMTHFACAEDPLQDAFTLKQAETFESVIKACESTGIKIPYKHASNSPASARFNFPYFNMARIGLASFGLYASSEAQKALELKLAISLISKIVGINICKAGESISYGRNYRVEKESRIAVLPIGYFDGLHRSYSGKGHVMVRGKKAPMVGNICMDFMMIDITEIPEASIGDSVLIFGEDEYGNYLSPEELAEQGGSIVYELITCLGPRIQKIFVHEESETVR